MSFEIELKFPVQDPAQFVQAIQELGARDCGSFEQQDRYFAHPSRAFAETNEALRIRSYDEKNCVTYKGPIIDTLTKMRREIEIPFAEGPDRAEQFAEVLHILGFTEVRTVTKHRRTFKVTWQQRALEFTVDRVDGLGTFVEIETIATEEGKDEARDCILQLAAQLGMTNSERRSYLQMLQEADNA